MPTGYTSIIDNGNPTAAEFLWRCARGLGLLFHMRDEPLGVPVTPPPPADEYYRKRAEETAQEVLRLEALTPEQIEQEARDIQQQNLTAITAYEEKDAAVYAKYAQMRNWVAQFEPPAGLESLKSLALEQLSTGAPYLRRRDEKLPVPVPAAQWHVDRLAQARRMAASAAEDWAKEQRRAEERMAAFVALQQALANFHPEQAPTAALEDM